MSRYEKLAHFFGKILKVSDVAELVAAAAERFTRFSRRAPFVYLDQYSEWRDAKTTLGAATGVVAVCDTWSDIFTLLELSE